MKQRNLVLTVTLVSGALALSACSSLGASTGNDSSSNVSDSDVTAVTTNIDGESTVDAGARIKATAQDQWLIEKVSVSVPGQDSQEVADPGANWKSEPLAPGQTTAVTLTMRNQNNGDTTNVTRNVLAGPATDTFSAALTPRGGTYGVGIIPKVTFSKSVPAKDRAEMEKRMTVTTSPTEVAGSWRWTDSTTAAFRPAKFWPGRTNVTVKADLEGARISKTKSQPMSWGDKNKKAQFKTGREMVIKISSGKHQAKVYIDGKVKHTMGVSMGKPGYTTRSGIKTLTDKHVVQRMTNVGVTTDSVYDLQVPYAMRLTSTGEFLHAAPWNGNIGYANTSHGCTNLNYSDAVWVFNRMKWGDPVITRGTGRPMEDSNGPGALWNIPYSKWASGSGTDGTSA